MLPGSDEGPQAGRQGLAVPLALAVEVQLGDHEGCRGAEPLVFGEGLEVRGQPGEVDIIGADVARGRSQYPGGYARPLVQLVGNLRTAFDFVPSGRTSAAFGVDRRRPAKRFLDAAQLVIG